MKSYITAKEVKQTRNNARHNCNLIKNNYKLNG